ncbi:hypothetical protein GF362_04110 [Candidatus Dojkabacteria bacterium]|nr:hypothetical protein [Candidatus Dojkabacteria bacterium]
MTKENELKNLDNDIEQSINDYLKLVCKFVKELTEQDFNFKELTNNGTTRKNK